MAKSKIQKAREAVYDYLREKHNIRYILLCDLAEVADEAAGKELFDSLYDYEAIVPGNVEWVSADKLDQQTLCRALGGRFLALKNPYYYRDQ